MCACVCVCGSRLSERDLYAMQKGLGLIVCMLMLNVRVRLQFGRGDRLFAETVRVAQTVCAVWNV